MYWLLEKYVIVCVKLLSIQLPMEHRCKITVKSIKDCNDGDIIEGWYCNCMLYCKFCFQFLFNWPVFVYKSIIHYKCIMYTQCQTQTC